LLLLNHPAPEDTPDGAPSQSLSTTAIFFTHAKYVAHMTVVNHGEAGTVTGTAVVKVDVKVHVY
jgi:hypothetical protein